MEKIDFPRRAAVTLLRYPFLCSFSCDLIWTSLMYDSILKTLYMLIDIDDHVGDCSEEMGIVTI